MSRLKIAASAAILLAALWAGLGVIFSPESSGASVDATSVERVERLQKKLDSIRPQGIYVLIDTGANRLYLKKGSEVLMEAVCSTGSRRTLVAGDRRWTFETPRGTHRIRSKIHNPVWRRPDWAFLEEGKSVPAREADRFEEGVLGDYALDIGDGYFIHGTLYNRLLGQNVTHGCVRLGDRDLEFLFKRVKTGTRVFIY